MTNPMTPTEQDKELREKLAAIEHERWADWQRYVHSVCYENKGIGGEPTGALTIPSELARRWEGQIETPYHELSEKEKDSDREQVDRYWQLITSDRKRVALEARISELKMWELPENEIQMVFANPCNICGHDYPKLRKAQQDRLSALKAQQEEV